MSLAHGEARKVVDISEDAMSNEVKYTMGARGISKISMQVIFANYTSVNMKLQGTLDGSTWSDIPGMAVSTSGDIVTATFGPLSQIRIDGTGTLSGSADTLEVWLMVEFAPK